MEKFSNHEIKKNENDEVDYERIQRLFIEMPSEKIELLANHLARPDGFSKALIVGSIATSAELQEKIGNEFVKTHRGYYMRFPSSYHMGKNDDISFNIGKPQRLYQESSTLKRAKEDWKGGIGFTVPARELFTRENVKPSWGNLSLYESIQCLKKSNDYESSFARYFEISEKEASKIDRKPPKEDFLTLVNIARKAGKLKAGDRAEINMQKENGQFPRLSLGETIILIPQKSKEVFKRYLDKKIKEVNPYAEKIKNVFGVDVSKLNAEEVLRRYANIYWYPQKNIDLAVEYLSTHPEVVSQFLKKTKNNDPTETGRGEVRKNP